MSPFQHLVPPLREIKKCAESAACILRDALEQLIACPEQQRISLAGLTRYLEQIMHMLLAASNLADEIQGMMQHAPLPGMDSSLSYAAEQLAHIMRSLKSAHDELKQKRMLITERTASFSPSFEDFSNLLQQIEQIAAWLLNEMQQARQTYFMMVEDSRPRAVQPISQLQISAVASTAVEPGRYGSVDLLLWEDSARYMAEYVLREYERDVRELFGGMFDVRSGTQIRVSMSSPDIEIEEPEETLTWRGKFLRFGFAFRVPEDYSRKQILLTARVYFDDVPATRLRLLVDCNTPSSQHIPVHRQDIRSVFMSYASEDRLRVISIIQGMQQVRPDLDIFLDVDMLRSGENWESRLLREIDARDMLYLCWSRFAEASPYVTKEWRYALKTKGMDAITPIPLEPAEYCPPPQELSHLHFNNRLLYILRLKE